MVATIRERLSLKKGINQYLVTDKYNLNKLLEKTLIGTPKENRTLGSPRCRWEGNIRVDLKAICMNTRSWFTNYWRAVVNA